MDFVNNRIQLHGYVNNAAMAYDDIVTNLKLGQIAIHVFGQCFYSDDDNQIRFT